MHQELVCGIENTIFLMDLTNESNTRFSDESNIMLYVSGDL